MPQILDRDQAEPRKRRLPEAATIALDIIAMMGKRSLPWHEFELRMHERGCDSRACLAAAAALERRQWATRTGKALEITEAGYAVAIRGVRAAPADRTPPKTKHRQLPRGLFG